MYSGDKQASNGTPTGEWKSFLIGNNTSSLIGNRNYSWLRHSLNNHATWFVREGSGRIRVLVE
jgi:hypothetical protein